MSLTYQQLLHDVALRMNALVGAQFAALQTTYTTTPLTQANFKSADWPFDSFRDAIIMAEETVAQAIASTPSHPWRAYLDSQSASLANGVALPSIDTSSNPIIGVYGGVVDTGDGKPCTRQPIEVVRRTVQETWRLYPLYIYATDGNRIYHSRPSVRLNVCKYNQTTQLTAFAANGNSVLPDAARSVIVAVAVSLMLKEKSNVDGAALYSTYAEAALREIRAGAIPVPTKPLPAQAPAATAG
jgi:hypothetical protein